ALEMGASNFRDPITNIVLEVQEKINLVHITGRIWWHWCNQPTSWLNCMNLSKAQPEQIVPLITNFSVDILHANSAEARRLGGNYSLHATGVSISRWIMSKKYS
ncbi:hypothetical protein ACJX0J_027856, partial [Zea mays]